MRGRRIGFRDKKQIETRQINCKKITTLLQRGDKFRLTDIASEISTMRSTVRECLKELMKEGIVREDQGFYSYNPGLVFELTPLDEETVKAVSEGPPYLFSHRTDARSVGGSRIIVKSPRKEEEQPEIRLMGNPLEDEFFFHNPFWISYFFSHALRQKKIDHRYFSGEKNIEEIEGHELNDMWEWLFGKTSVYALLLSVDPNKLLEWLKTPEGREDLKRALPEKTRKEIYAEASKIWREREAWDQRLKGLEK